jgi:hypothetical protein
LSDLGGFESLDRDVLGRAARWSQEELRVSQPLGRLDVDDPHRVTVPAQQEIRHMVRRSNIEFGR